jgi:hypothetical protein
MANMNTTTEELKAAARAVRNVTKVDIITARHTQALAILDVLIADIMIPDESVLPLQTISSTFWAVQALLEQAQEAARDL